MEYRKVFDEIPEQFDKYRPRYSAELFTSLIQYAGISPGVPVLEIGPGIGTLTKELAERYKKVISLEIDDTLIPVLGYTLGEYNNVEIINRDVMKVDLHELLAPYLKEGRVSVCANLPYYINAHPYEASL